MLYRMYVIWSALHALLRCHHAEDYAITTRFIVKMAEGHRHP